MGIFLKDINLKGKTALITGATKGLGRGAAIAIAEAGGNVIAIGRNQLELNTLKNEIIGLKLLITEKEKQIEKLTKEKTEKSKTPAPWPFPTLGSKTKDS